MTPGADRGARRRHALARPIGWSLALHVLVLSGIDLAAPEPASALSANRVAARLAKTGRVPAVKPEAAPAPPPNAKTKRVASETSQLTAAESAPVVAPPVPEAVETSATRLVPLAPSPMESERASQSSPAPAKPQLAVASDRPNNDVANDISRYRLAIGVAAKRFKRYPALAHERGWEGTSEVLIVFAPASVVPSVRLGRTSGHKVLDRDAVALVGAAIRQVQAPASLQTNGQRVSVEIEYRLEE